MTSFISEEISSQFSVEKQVEFIETQLEGHANYHSMLEAKFREKLSDFQGKGFELEIKRNVDQDTLSETLQSPDVNAVFWMSHGGYCPTEEIGKVTKNIFDWRSFFILPAFQKIHLNLKVLAVVSCASDAIVRDYLKQNGVFDQNPSLMLVTMDTAVDAKVGFLAALDFAKNHIGPPAPSTSSISVRDLTKSNQAMPVKITRYCTSSVSDPLFFPSVRLEGYMGKLLTTMPSCNRGEKVSKEMKLSLSDIDHDVTVTSGARALSIHGPFDLGKFEIQSQDPAFQIHWKLMSLTEELPPGTFRQVFMRKKFPVIEFPPQNSSLSTDIQITPELPD